MDQHPTALTPHPYAQLFPPMAADDFAELLADIRDHGQREPIIVDQHNRIVDGLHRYRACVTLDIKIKHIKIDRRNLSDDEARDLVVSLNLRRRHLSTSQRAAIAADMANLKQGGTQPADLPDAVSQTEAAKLMRVSERAIRSAVKVKREDPQLHEQVKADAITVHAAEQKIKERSGKAKPKEVRKAKPLSWASTNPRDSDAIPAVYCGLFNGLDDLPAHLTEHSLPPGRVIELIALMRKCIALLETHNQCSPSEEGEPISAQDSPWHSYPE